MFLVSYYCNIVLKISLVREEDNCSISKSIEYTLSIPLVISGSTNVRLSHEGRKNLLSQACMNGVESHFDLDSRYATSNGTGVQNLKKGLLSWNNLVLKGDYIHMRCYAHILNLIVSSGLKEIDNFVLRIRATVKYIRSSPSRFMKFKECVERQNIEYKGRIWLVVETRWNSTYLMLDVAFKHKKAFDKLEFYDTKYATELGKGIGLPSYEDWEYVEFILPFLSIFL